MLLNVLDILGATGAVARRLSHYEARPMQLEMAQAVYDAIENNHHLMVEAGTGVGKSFAYLTPAMLKIMENREKRGMFDDMLSDEERARVVIATHTIHLQEQLIQKDIPFLQSVFPDEFSVVLVKGRSNYVCKRRLTNAMQQAHSLFSTAEEILETDRVYQWAQKTGEGAKQGLNPVPARTVWEEICCEQGNCLGKNCQYNKDCFYQKARRRVFNADILIVNHALFFSDLSVRMEDGQLLPKYTSVIFDEAHTIEEVAGFLGMTEDQTIKALLFVTLCRCAGIPARWQSGLYADNNGAGCHDWAMFYVAPYGWLWADPSFGGSAFRAGAEERRNHYFGNLDMYRTVTVNTYQSDFEPASRFWRTSPRGWRWPSSAASSAARTRSSGCPGRASRGHARGADDPHASRRAARRGAAWLAPRPAGRRSRGGPPWPRRWPEPWFRQGCPGRHFR